MSKDRTVIWIDTTSGTWGEVEGSNGRLVIVDLDAQAELDTKAGETVDAQSLIAFLDGASDSEIMEYGVTYGKAPWTGDAEKDNDGQFVIYTGLYDSDRT